MPRTKSGSKVTYYPTALFYRDFFFFSPLKQLTQALPTCQTGLLENKITNNPNNRVNIAEYLCSIRKLVVLK